MSKPKNHPKNEMETAPIPNIIEGTAAISNLNQWGSWISLLEEQIEESGEASKQLKDAAIFVSWILLYSEYISYRIRSKFFFESKKLEDTDAFDMNYGNMITQIKQQATTSGKLPDDVFEALKFTIACRHIIIHKGYPNLQLKPATKNSKNFDFQFIQSVSQVIKSPSNYDTIRTTLLRVEKWINENSTQSSFTSGPIQCATPENQ